MGDNAIKSVKIMIKTFNTNRPWPQYENNTNYIVKLVLFLIWPLGSFLYCLGSSKTRSSYFIFFLFFLLICWHFSPTGYSERYDDFLGILERFNDTNFTFAEIAQQFKDFFTFSAEAPKELYENVTIFLVKLFTDNYHFYFLLCAIPVAYCQLKVANRITSDSRYISNFWGIMVVFMLLFPRDIVTVQNPRFATGFWICIYFTIKFLCDEKKLLYLIPILMSPIFHSAMWGYVLIFVLTLLIPSKLRLLEIVALCTIPCMFMTTYILDGIDVNLFPTSISSWVERYMSEEKYATHILNVGKSGLWWISATFDIFLKVVYILMTLRIIRERAYSENEEANNIYKFYLILFSFVNIFQFVPVLGERYFWFTRVYCVFLWYKCFADNKVYKRDIYLLICACLWPILHRYGYIMGGALSVNTPIDLFFTPLPYLAGKGLFW